MTTWVILRSMMKSLISTLLTLREAHESNNFLMNRCALDWNLCLEAMDSLYRITTILLKLRRYLPKLTPR